MAFFRKLLAGPIAAGLLTAMPAGAGWAQTPQVEDLVRSMARTLAEAQAISVHVEKTFDVVTVTGLKIQYSGAVDLEVRRPDRLYVSYGDDMSAKEAWYDGTRFTLHDHLANVYGHLPARSNIDETLDALKAEYGVLLPLAELLSSDAYDQFAGKVIDKVYVGQHDVGGQPAHHVIFSGETADWQLWIRTDGTPLPLKMVVTRTDIPEQPQHIFLFSDWNLAADLPDEDFVADVPADASLARFLPREGN